MKRSDESGATMMEYAIVCVLIAVLLYSGFDVLYKAASCHLRNGGSAVAGEVVEDCQ